MNISLLRRIMLPILTFLALSAFISCSAAPESGSTKPVVFVSIPPQAWFVQQLVGDGLSVEVLVEPGSNPHTFEPSPRQLAGLGTSAAYYSIGIDFEQALLPRLAAQYPELAIIDMAAGIQRRELEEHAHGEEAEGEEEHGEEEGGLDPHVWLSPVLAKAMTATLADDLSKRFPELSATIDQNKERLYKELEVLDTRLATILAPIKGQTILVYHPAFGYLADAYGLIQEAIEVGGSEPGPQTLASIIEEAKDDGVRVIFVQPQFSSRSAQTIAEEINGVVVPLDDLAPDWMGNMVLLAEALAKGLD